MEANKICSKCQIEKSLTEFHKDKHTKSGRQSSCKICKKYQNEELSRKYARQETREIKEKKVCGCCKNEKKVLEFTKNISRRDGFGNLCKKCQNEYIKTRRRNDPEFKLLTNLRVRLYDALKGKSKSQTTRQLIGVDFETFSKWIEFQFEEGMVLQNYGSAWHIDHVLPISSFNLLDEEELHKAMNWKNLRPLPPVKNIKKSNKIDLWLYVMQEVKADYFIKHLEEI